jgi:5-methylcytosine-specific restriction endonuclease McrA
MKLPTSQTDAVMARCRKAYYSHQNRARANGTLIDYEIEGLRQLVSENPLCHWCRLPVAFDFQFDHLYPVARGGSLCLWNLTVSCSRCNSLRGQLLESETMELLEFLRGLHPIARADLERRLLAGAKRYAPKR